MNKLVKTKELFDCSIPHLASLFDECEYPWQILPKIKELAKKLTEEGLPGYTLYAEGILIGENVKIAKNATIEPPSVIGHGTQLRPGAYIRGNVIIGSNCVVGNSTELKNCILLDGVQAPHYNYIGDSILGNRAHTGAGVICSNLKSDRSNIVIHGEVDHPTDLRKVGAFLGDGSDIGCNSVLNPGTVVGKHTAVYPLTSLRGVYPADCIVKSTDNIIKKI